MTDAVITESSVGNTQAERTALLVLCDKRTFDLFRFSQSIQCRLEFSKQLRL